jgi:hypothetical protein
VLEPVQLVIERGCHFKAKPCGRCDRPKSNPAHRKKGGTCVFQRRNGCARCSRAKNDPVHFGAPDSFNALAGRDPQVYRQLIETWANVLMPLLEQSGLPKGLGKVMVEGECSFGDLQERDAGNHRVMIEKALGDALVRGGWLPADTWSRYEFGNLARREVPGKNWTFLMLFPAEAEIAPNVGDPLTLPLPL